jgi:hypothetical protein
MPTKGQKSKKSSSSRRRNEAEKVEQILKMVEERVPPLISPILDSIVGGQSADPRQEAEQIASFYETLVDSGMSPEQAFALTQQYLKSKDKASLLGQLIKDATHVQIHTHKQSKK